MLGSLIAGGASLAGSALSFLSAKKNLKKQEQMSDTSVQRRVADLRAAGLNPVLAATSGGLQGAAVPQPQMPDTSGFSSAASSASQVSQAKTSSELARSTIALQGASTAREMETARNLSEQNLLLKAQTLTELERAKLTGAQSAFTQSQDSKLKFDTIESKLLADFYNTPDGSGVVRERARFRDGNVPALLGSLDGSLKPAKQFLERGARATWSEVRDFINRFRSRSSSAKQHNGIMRSFNKHYVVADDK